MKNKFKVFYLLLLFIASPYPKKNVISQIPPNPQDCLAILEATVKDKSPVTQITDSLNEEYLAKRHTKDNKLDKVIQQKRELERKAYMAEQQLESSQKQLATARQENLRLLKIISSINCVTIIPALPITSDSINTKQSITSKKNRIGLGKKIKKLLSF